MITDVGAYWEERYAAGKRGSGAGSVGDHARAKAAGVNDLIKSRGVVSVVDWGCGDGEVARWIEAEKYLGLDLSLTAIELCRQKMPTRQFGLINGTMVPERRADLALSLDVIYHLVDDALYQRYLELLFASAPLVYIVSTCRPQDPAAAGHVRHRVWIPDLPEGWLLTPAPSDHLNGERGAWIAECAL